ncbi:Uncharacterised protein [uncultured Blautia sp.]|nr:Uncharacterised protein [uncultured Blautia sp.]
MVIISNDAELLAVDAAGLVQLLDRQVHAHLLLGAHQSGGTRQRGVQADLDHVALLGRAAVTTRVCGAAVTGRAAASHQGEYQYQCQKHR